MFVYRCTCYIKACYIFLHLAPWQDVGYDYPHCTQTEIQNSHMAGQCYLVSEPGLPQLFKSHAVSSKPTSVK